ncbi:MAG: DNA cytosine methyltransferase [Bryobacteraceae bacterium]|nr:DNA cytosine methyltransferase [Bryobacteraceae bacterium]
MSFEISWRRRDGKIVRLQRFRSTATETVVDDLARPDLDPARAWWQATLRGARPNPPPLRRELRILDVFSGAGGLALGAAMASESLGRLPRLLAAIDVDAGALRVHRRNLGTERLVNADARSLVHGAINGADEKFRFADEPRLVADELRRLTAPDLVIGGPPCEGHSNLNNRSRRDDTRNELLLTAVFLAVASGARAMILENVRHVQRDRRGTLKAADSALRQDGWWVRSVVLDAGRFGAPQTRERLFLVASRDDICERSFQAVINSLETQPMTVRDAIEDLLDADEGNVFDTPACPSEENRKRIDYLFDNELWNLPNEVRPACHRDGTSYTAVYGRLWWDRPSPTVTTGFGTPGRGRYIHPKKRRLITPHEAARLQTFPDWFDLLLDNSNTVSRKQLEKWIGDAVPPVLGFVITSALLGALQAAKNEP